MNRKFKNPEYQKLYSSFRALGPTWVSSEGAQVRGAIHKNAYWLAYDGYPCRHVEGSAAELAWKAGADNRAADLKAGTYKTTPTTYALQATRVAAYVASRTSHN